MPILENIYYTTKIKMYDKNKQEDKNKLTSLIWQAKNIHITITTGTD